MRKMNDGRSQIGSAGFNTRRVPITTLANRPIVNDSPVKAKSKTAIEEESLAKPTSANFFDSSDDDAGFGDLLAKNADKKKLNQCHSHEEVEDKLTFETGDFV
jgi:hypothetical protein